MRTAELNTGIMDTADIEQFLRSLGYEILFRADGWTECLVVGHGERWLGRGTDNMSAIQDIERQMFPSFAASAARTRVTITLPSFSCDPVSEANTESVVMKEPPEEVGDPETQIETPAPEEMETGERVSTEETVSTEEGPPAAQMSDTYVSPQPDEPDVPDLTKDEALEIVTALDDEITDGIDDMAVMTTMHQRLHIAAWIFRGRAVQEKFPRDSQIEEAVHQIAVRLTGICKVYWPGSVRALQVYTTPTQALEGLVRTSKTPLKWAESAEILEVYLEDLEGRSNRDDFGWRDGAQCRPDAPDPDAVLSEAVHKITLVVGAIGEPLDDKQRKIPGDHVLSELETLVMAAHLLRWVRRSCSDHQLWGKAMGALRWASRQPRDRGSMRALQDVLSDDYLPANSWAELLGRDSRVNEKNRLRKQVMGTLPRPGGLEEDLMAWLHKAFQAFTNPQIAKMANDVREEIMELTNTDFADADRNTRSRLRKLQAILRAQQDVTSVKLPDVSEIEDAPVESKTSQRPDPAQELLACVQEITAGKRVLFVTNRDDERLRQDLERELKCEVTLKDGGNPRTMGSAIKSVDRDKYDFVLMATGFNNHSADASLCRAAKMEGIPYVRVQKGRLAATVRALGRAFNVSPERKATDENSVAHAG